MHECWLGDQARFANELLARLLMSLETHMRSLSKLSDQVLIEEYIELERLINKQAIKSELQLKLLELYQVEIRIRAGRSGMASML